VTDGLEELRHELADVEAAIEADGAGDDLLTRRACVEDAILSMERAAREEMGAQPQAVDATAEEAAQARPAATDLVVPALPPGEERDHATVIVLDKHDEDQILAVMEDRMDKVLLYDFPQDGSRLVDLSINGVLECVRQMNQTTRARVAIMPETLQVEIVDVPDRGPHFQATVAARDEIAGLVMIGTAMEPQNPRRRNGGTYYDKFARTKAISKAQRNALKQHIPERLRQAIIALHKRDATRLLEVKHGAGAAAAAELPPPVVSERAEALVAECREIYVEIKALPGGLEKLKPGMFNHELSRARSSEDALESYRDALVSRRDTLKEATANG
jgi:hypothetical protein